MLQALCWCHWAPLWAPGASHVSELAQRGSEIGTGWERKRKLLEIVRFGHWWHREEGCRRAACWMCWEPSGCLLCLGCGSPDFGVAIKIVEVYLLLVEAHFYTFFQTVTCEQYSCIQTETQLNITLPVVHQILYELSHEMKSVFCPVCSSTRTFK